MDPVGLGYALASAVCVGSFAVLSKLPALRKARVSPYVFNLWTCVGVALSALSLWTVIPVEFTALGLASGAMFVLAMGNLFLAIHLLDNVALATGLWYGTAMIVAFCSSVLTGGHISSMPIAALAMLQLLAGIACMSSVGWMAAKQDSLAQLDVGKGVDAEAGALLPEDPEDEATQMAVVGGLSAAGAAGLLGGLLLTPMHFSPLQGVAFLPSFGVGVLIACPFTLLLQLLFPSGTMSAKQLQVAAAPGLGAGLLWAAGTLCSLQASQLLPFSVAYPVTQSGFLVSGAIGAFALSELPTPGLRMRYGVAVVVLLAACALLGQVRE